MAGVWLVSIQVGTPELVARPGEEPWTTAMRKLPVRGPVWLSMTGLEGDAVANTRVHGGVEKAALCFAAAHYPLLRRELGLPFIDFGCFGENLTFEGADETTVCIGDVYELGAARVQVNQPREPCDSQSRYWGLPHLRRHATETGRTGWYIRVLREGELRAPAAATLLERPFPEWTVARANALFYSRAVNTEQRELAHCPALSPGWQRRLSARAEAARAAFRF